MTTATGAPVSLIGDFMAHGHPAAQRDRFEILGTTGTIVLKGDRLRLFEARSSKKTSRSISRPTTTPRTSARSRTFSTGSTTAERSRRQRTTTSKRSSSSSRFIRQPGIR